ncbi:MAG: type II toxin-antitoxin system HicA family toxin [Candidatus Berkelbacteria bacterium]|nr:type II toxin-antitoxin system HicA family toxin [Candidatus Berkelbacteria bacterium]
MSKFFQLRGFTVSRQTGSHQRLKHPDGRGITISIHNQPIAPGTFSAILRQAELTQDQFQKLWEDKWRNPASTFPGSGVQ